MTATLLGVAGAALLALLFVDIFSTIFTLRGGGFFTTRWTRLVWRAVIAAHRRSSHRRSPRRRLLGLVGPALLVGVVFVWWLLLSAGWVLVFVDVSSIQSNSTSRGAPNDVFDSLYFVGSTLSTAGYGDLVPTEFPWTLFAGLAATSASFFATMALSYVIPVVNYALERRIFARHLSTLGEDAVALVRTLWFGPRAGWLDDGLFDLMREVEELGQRHLAYPVLHLFQSPQRDETASCVILHLADALFLARRTLGSGPPSPLQDAWWRILEGYTHRSRIGGWSQENIPLSQHDERLRGMVEDIEGARLPADFSELVRAYAPVRSRLLLLCREDGFFDET